tara:strand:+ start:2726 stop:3406 length:681 start_codon:yes stop_codon:yes gene_type:complete
VLTSTELQHIKTIFEKEKTGISTGLKFGAPFGKKLTIMKLKLLLCAVGLFLMATQIHAQHVVRFSPLSLIKGKAKIHYEYGGVEKLGFGIIAAGYYGIYPGFRIQPYARYYITDESLKGLYVQPKFHFSQNTFEITMSPGTIDEETVKNDINELGGSLDFGWQFLLGGNENIVVDIFTGYRFSNLQGKDYNNTETTEGATDLVSETLYTALHSSKFDLGLSVGFKF